MDLREQGLDQRMVKALAHPLRVQILTVLNERVASPNQISQQLDEPLGNVSYHTRMLVTLGVIELVDTQPRRGAVEHFYRALQRPFFSSGDWQRLPASARQSVFDAILQQAWEDIGLAAQHGGFDREDVHVSRTPLVLDAEGYDAVVALLAQVVDRAKEIQAESADRLEGQATPGTELTEMVILHFDRGDEPAPTPPD